MPRVHAPAVEGAEPLVVEARVTGGPDGDLDVPARGHGRRRTGRGRSGDGSRPCPSCTDRETACALHHGDTNAQQALAAGRLKVHGDLAALGGRSDALAALGDVFGPVRARTSTTGSAEESARKSGGSLPG